MRKGYRYISSSSPSVPPEPDLPCPTPSEQGPGHLDGVLLHDQGKRFLHKKGEQGPDRRQSLYYAKCKRRPRQSQRLLHHLPYCCQHACQSLVLQMLGSPSAFQQASDCSNCSIHSILGLHILLSSWNMSTPPKACRVPDQWRSPTDSNH